MADFNRFKTNVTLRSASGTLTAAETATGVATGGFNNAIVRLDMTLVTCAAGEEVDMFLQTTYNGGTDWVDIECVHFENADNGTTPTLLLRVGPGRPTAADVAEIETDATLADDTKLDLPLGSQLRWKTVITNTPSYAYNSEMQLWV